MLTLNDSMKLHYKQVKDIIFIDKPAGFEVSGLAKCFGNVLQRELFPAFAATAEVTGCQVFCENKDIAKSLEQKIASPECKKIHWLVTASVSAEPEYRSNQERLHFQRIKRSPFFELWQVEGGRGDEIRAAAAEIGLPILGDSNFGGARFPLLCLHFAELHIPEYEAWVTPPPRILERLALLLDPALSKLVMAVDCRQRLYNFLPHREQTLRLAHGESDDLRLDLLGPVLWGQWYNENDPSPRDLQRIEILATLLSRKFYLRKMPNRGKDPISKQEWSSPEAPSDWTALEGDMKFQFSNHRGISAGLFLDQRQNRQFVRENSNKKRVLNLFAYTCGFSVAAALGGATEVVSVDVSRDFLEWGKENFSLNNLSSEGYEFFKQDVMLFLRGALKRSRQFDLIICDPPSFGRSSDSVFSLERDFGDLVSLCEQLLSPGGYLLFCCNLEKWSSQVLERKFRQQTHLLVQPSPRRALDYERPDQNFAMKTALMQKIQR